MNFAPQVRMNSLLMAANFSKQTIGELTGNFGRSKGEAVSDGVNLLKAPATQAGNILLRMALAFLLNADPIEDRHAGWWNITTIKPKILAREVALNRDKCRLGKQIGAALKKINSTAI